MTCEPLARILDVWSLISWNEVDVYSEQVGLSQLDIRPWSHIYTFVTFHKGSDQTLLLMVGRINAVQCWARLRQRSIWETTNRSKNNWLLYVLMSNRYLYCKDKSLSLGDFWRLVVQLPISASKAGGYHELIDLRHSFDSGAARQHLLIPMRGFEKVLWCRCRRSYMLDLIWFMEEAQRLWSEETWRDIM